MFAQGALVPELDGSCFHAVQTVRGLSAPGPLSRTSGPAPGPLFFAPPKKRGEKKGGPTLRSPLACGEGFPAVLASRPRPELAALAFGSLRSNRLAESEGSRAYGTRAGLLCCSAAQRGWNTQIPNIRTSARCLQSKSRGPAVGCWLLKPPLRRRAAQTRGPCAAGAHRDLTRAACLSGGSEASAASSARGPLVEQRREPLPAFGGQGRAQ